MSGLHDPFALSGPALVNVSGGSTSAYMLRRILDANGGKLPEHAHAGATCGVASVHRDAVRAGR